MNIAVFVSGNGSNLQAIIDSVKNGKLKCGIALVVSDKKDAYALKRAKKAGIQTFVLDKKGFNTREDYDKSLINQLERKNVDLVVLAGFMRLLSPYFVEKYKNRIMNIHPALLPSFKGTHGIEDAFNFGVKITGVTVHFVDEKLDNGPIILQEQVLIGKNDTLDSLEERIHQVEHRLYPQAIKLYQEGKVTVKGRRVIIKD